MYNVGRIYTAGERYNTIPVHIVSQWYTHLAHALPVIVDEQLRPVVLLRHAHDIYIHETLQGEHRVTFRLPYQVLPELATGSLVDLAGRIYRIEVMDNLDEPTGRLLAVEGIALWSDLAKAVMLEGRTWTNATAVEMLGWLVFLTPWRVGESAVTTRRSLHWAGGCNRLGAIRQVEKIFSAEIVWDTAARTVSIVPAGGVDRGLFFLRKRNLRSLSVQASTLDTIHRLYPRGQAGVTIAPVNRGIDFIEVPSPISPPLSALLVDERFTEPQALLEYAQVVLAARGTPRMTYACDIMDISALGDEAPVQVGDIVTVYDEDTDVTLKTRVVRMMYDVESPHESRIELSTATPDTSDIISQLQEELAVHDRLQLAPFNTLLSSVDFHSDGMVTRYEDGTRYTWAFVRDPAGRITRLTNLAYGTRIDIRHFTTGVPS